LWNRIRWQLAVVVAGCCLVTGWTLAHSEKKSPPTVAATRNPSLSELLLMPPKELENVDIALMNLRCAEGLRGAEALDIPLAIQRLDQFAQRVETETTRNLHRFRENPADYENSEAYFRLLMMAMVMQEDFKVRYNPARITSPDVPEPNDEFYEDSKDIFLNGLIGSPMTGTCSSMPVLYVAVGRRLGYPLYLVSTKEHLFVRWQDSRAHLNMDATSRGFGSYDDDYYKSWPCKVNDEEIKANNYFKPMTPKEELACFMSNRGACLMASKQFREAVDALRLAYMLAPHISTFANNWATAEREANKKLLALRMRQMDQVNWLLDHEIPKDHQTQPPAAGQRR
jgi:Transglutaminase-like superfamily